MSHKISKVGRSGAKWGGNTKRIREKCADSLRQ